MKHKKRGYLCLLLTGIAIITSHTAHATFTCWNSEMIKKYNWEDFRAIFEKMVSQQPKPEVQKPAVQKPEVQNAQTQLTQNHPPKTQAKHECDCMICATTVSKNDMVELTCCKGKKICKVCLEKLQNPTETVQDPGDPTVTHPQNCYYAQGANSVAQAQTRAYETATPRSHQSWTWKQIGRYWYFLEGGYYWRFAGTNTTYGAANGVLWRYIPANIACPYCKQKLQTKDL